MTTIEIIRLTAKEFSETPDEELEQWIELVKPLVSKKLFGSLYNMALAYMVCHKMKLSGHGENAMGGLVGDLSAMGFSVASISDGGTSISFGGSQGNNLTADAEYALTGYGMQYLDLRRKAIIPIRVSGEDSF